MPQVASRAMHSVSKHVSGRAVCARMDDWYTIEVVCGYHARWQPGEQWQRAAWKEDAPVLSSSAPSAIPTSGLWVNNWAVVNMFISSSVSAYQFSDPCPRLCYDKHNLTCQTLHQHRGRQTRFQTKTLMCRDRRVDSEEFPRCHYDCGAHIQHV